MIEKIVALATREVPHVLGMKGNLMHFVQTQLVRRTLTKGVTVEVTDDNRVVVNISVIIEYGAYAPDIFDDVKARVTERLAAMTGLEVAAINLRIDDVVTPEEYAERQKHLIDNLKARRRRLRLFHGGSTGSRASLSALRRAAPSVIFARASWFGLFMRGGDGKRSAMPVLKGTIYIV